MNQALFFLQSKKTGPGATAARPGRWANGQGRAIFLPTVKKWLGTGCGRLFYYKPAGHRLAGLFKMRYTLLFGEAGSQPPRLAHKEVMSMTFSCKATVVSAGLAAGGGKARAVEQGRGIRSGPEAP